MISLANFTVSLELVVEQLTRIGDLLEQLLAAQQETGTKSPSPSRPVSRAKISFIDPANPPAPRKK